MGTTSAVSTDPFRPAALRVLAASAFAFVLTSAAFSASSHADLVKLKDGVLVSGTVVDRDPSEVTLDVSGGRLHLELDDIDWTLEGTADEIENQRRAGEEYLSAVRSQENGRWNEAAEAYSRAVELLPSEASLRNNLGVSLAKTGKMKEAVNAFETALSLRPSDATASSNLANAYATVGRDADALAAFERTLRLRPRDAGTLARYGSLLYRLGRYEDALKQFSAAAQIRRDADVLNDAGAALAKLGRRSEAEARFREALRLEPDNQQAKLNLEKLSGGFAGA